MSPQSTFPFGKHKGTPIDEVPVDYLQWALANMGQLRPDTKAMIEGSIKRRQQGAAPAKQPEAKKASGPTSGSYDGGGIACPACGAMLDVTLAESPVPF